MLKSIEESFLNENKKMIREKLIFIVIIVIPLLANMLLGYEFKDDIVKKVPMVVLDYDNTSISRMITSAFEENEIFNVNYFAKNSTEVKKLIDQSSARVGMIIPKDFSKDIINLKSPKILMVYDGSHMSMTSAAKARATEILLTFKTGTFIKMIKAKLNLPEDVAQKIALTLKFSNRICYNPTRSYKYFLNPGFGTAIVQSGVVLMAAVAVRREELEKGKRKRVGYIIGKIFFYSLIGFVSLMISIFLQSVVFHVPYRATIVDGMILNLLLSVAISAFAIMVSTWMKDKMLSVQINAILFVPNTILAGYTWPVMSMPKFYQYFAKTNPFYHYVDNMRALYLKGTSIYAMQSDVIWFIAFISIVTFVGAIGIMKKDKNTKEEGESCVLS